jgi:hypothetical protein
MIDTSPPVHPTGVEHGANTGVVGMTLLQYYAGQALEGILAGRNRKEETDPTAIPEVSFNFAELMVKEYNRRYRGKE